MPDNNKPIIDWDLSPVGPARTEDEIRAIEKTPLSDRNLPTNLYDILRMATKEFGEFPAVSYLPNGSTNDDATEVTFDGLLEGVTQTANFFHSLGLSFDDPIAFITPNIVETLYVYLAAETAGIALPINIHTKLDTIISLLNEGNAKALVIYGPDPSHRIWPNLDTIRSQVPSIQHFIVINSETPFNRDNIDFELHDFHLEIAKQDKHQLIFDRNFNGDEIAAYCHSSGTTGKPKIIKRTQNNQVFYIWTRVMQMQMKISKVAQLQMRISKRGPCYITGFQLTDNDNQLLIILTNMIKGGYLVIAGKNGYYDTNLIHHFWGLIEKYRVNFFLAAPFLFDTLLDSASLHKADLSSLKSIFYGGDHFPATKFKVFFDKVKTEVMQTYSLTENTYLGTSIPLTSVDHATDCIGIRTPYVQVKTVLLDENNQYQRDCKPNEVGMILMQGAGMTSGYINHDIDKESIDGWLNTGDLGRFDEAGKLWFCGREKYKIAVGTQIIEPHTYEKILESHPDVVAAIAVAKPSRKLKSVPIAYIVSSNRKIQSTILIDFCNSRLGNTYPLQDIIFIDQLPKTATQKVDRMALLNNAVKLTLEEELDEITNKRDIETSVKIENDSNRLALANIYITAKDEQSSSTVSREISSALAPLNINYNLVTDTD